MRRAWIAVLAVAALALPAAALADGDDSSLSGEKNRSKACKALRARMGPELFRDTYGTNHNKRNALGKCVSKHRQVFGKLVKQAISECRAEREAAGLRNFKGDDDSPRGEHGPKGDDRPNPDRRAFRDCVKAKLRALLAERRAAFETAAKSCEAERTADLAAFLEKYGKGEKKRHAFFRCVVQTVRANEAAAEAK